MAPLAMFFTLLLATTTILNPRHRPSHNHNNNNHLLSLTLSLLSLITLTLADCECGYLSTTGDLVSHQQPNDNLPSHQPHHALFTDLVESDFTRLVPEGEGDRTISANTDWVRQAFNLSHERARGQHGEMFAVENVDAAGQGEDDKGLKLIVRGGGELVENMVPVAEIDTKRLDMYFGTFRASMKITGERGTCAAFFWYFNDTQEIDMEFLSKDFDKANKSYPVNLVLQSREAALSGYNAAKTSNFVKAYLPFDPTEDFHEYRIDYLPGRVFFYADGMVLGKMDGPAVPSSAGHLILQHWSNGNRLWSGGPPERDAGLVVRYVKAYFNSSREERRRDWEGRCKDPKARGSVCLVPDVLPHNGTAGLLNIYTNSTTLGVDQLVFEEGLNGSYYQYITDPLFTNFQPSHILSR
ncbi:concanavalin A-like lectin/glucanase domain-containing protein [Apiosordaria backusii]|uniref:Concanavalin A-like lectin/glucanase domain-containing protein n=1 Tax=Apiosordaria backusii TaxID=314023 RepID=A0AA40BEG7_9PEZI|nr:concanavalin A-like lectin/glucanase domain-containing protein [Apiosordaria backusii]